MRLDGGATNAGTYDADHYLPAFFRKEYPKLIEFLDAYIDSVYGSSVSPEQLQLFMGDESWWDGADLTYENEDYRNLEKIKAFDKYRLSNYGVQEKVVDLLDNKTLKRKQTVLQSLNSLFLESSDGRTILASDEDNLPAETWLRENNLKELADNISSEVFDFDIISLIKVLSHLFKIKGTTECARIFFSIMYSGDVYIELPRNKIATLDDNFTLDSDIKLRDDYEYDEFTYIVNLVESKFDEIGTKYLEMYRRVFHASGFRCIVKTYSKEEWLIISGGYTNQPQLISVWKMFFNNEFANFVRSVQGSFVDPEPEPEPDLNFTWFDADFTLVEQGIHIPEPDPDPDPDPDPEPELDFTWFDADFTLVSQGGSEPDPDPDPEPEPDFTWFNADFTLVSQGGSEPETGLSFPLFDANFTWID